MVSTVKIFDITIPQKSGLCCAICKIISSEKNKIYSKYCAKLLKCREFLQETPQAMVAPISNRKILESGGSIYVIVTKEFFESYAFQNHCDALNIQMIDLIKPIPTYVYKACLLYTMEYKVAPQWNKVGSYLVEGQDFLSSTGNVGAIMLNIKEIHDNSAQLLMKAVNIRIPFVRLNRQHSLESNLQSPVRVLPSMKMANVLRVSKTIKSLFKDYEDLRAYWKNMHGYILPDYEDGFLFYNIEFFYFKSSIFLYPEMCLTSGPLEILPSATDPLSKIYKFIGDLRTNVIKLCEQQLDICPKNTFQTAVLTPYCTPILPRVRLPAYDIGYGTQSRRIRSVTPSLRMPDICDIPTKRSRISLSRADDSLTYATEIDDFELDIKPSLSNKLNLIKTAESISTILCDVDNISKSIVQKDESKSCYFKTKEQNSENKSFVELTNNEEKPKKLSLKEKLLRNF